MIFADILRTRAGIVSSPVDFDTLRLFSSVITSCSQIAQNLNNVFRWEILLSVSLSALFSFNHWVSISEANLEPTSTKKSLNVSVIEASPEIQYNTIQYNTIQYNTIQYNTIQYNTINFI